MSTVKLENRPNVDGLRAKTTEEFIKEYSEVVKNNKEFEKDVLEFSELMAKHRADVFIVTSFEAGKRCEQIRQGDIYLFRKGEASEGTLDNIMFEKYFPTIHEVSDTESMNLQLGTSITGDHRVVPLKGTHVTIQNCKIKIPVKKFRDTVGLSYDVKLLQADGPFCLVHTEHGNITCSKGTYLACTQLDARTLERMKD